MSVKSIIIFLALFITAFYSAEAQNIPAKPNPPRLVNDFAEALSADEEMQLEKLLVKYDDSTSNQVAIVLVNSLQGYPVEDFALKVLREWGIGNKKTNNGVLILASIAEHKVRIEIGYGLEGAIPDAIASRIIRNDIAPYFKQEKYFEGLQAAATSIVKAAKGEYTAPEGYSNKNQKEGGSILKVIIIIIIIIVFLSNSRRGGGGGFMSRRGFTGVGPTIFWPGGGGGGGWSGGDSGGGGFGGFGGGSGGGGGASGSW